ncbi:MAG TPA: hypothetical protein VGU43_02370 [Thermoplasmata archaeon]|nr:hypothetical protein [Thermoplasmata archaeon]
MYLLPVVLGGGEGDVGEVVAAARHLARDGHSLQLYCPAGVPLPTGVEPQNWDLPVRRVGRLRPSGRCAMTLAFDWGVTAGPERPGPLGRAGLWSDAVRAIERTYGPDRVLHVSLGEFARTLTSRQQLAERYREGGRPSRWIRRHVASARGREEAALTARLYRRFRYFDAPRVLHLFPTFGAARSFRREFPEAVPIGPVWEEPMPAPRRGAAPEWIWYASPSSSTALLPAIRSLVRQAPRPLRISVRGLARNADLPRRTSAVQLQPLPRLPRPEWRHRFADAQLRIVTGGRSLLEAVQVGGPFLYFNGVTGTGACRRRHRPEKLDALLRAWGPRLPSALRRDLLEFSRVRNATAILLRAAAEPRWRRSFPPRPPPVAFRPPYGEGGQLLRAVAGELAAGAGAQELVARTRARQLEEPSSGGPGRSP